MNIQEKGLMRIKNYIEENPDYVKLSPFEKDIIVKHLLNVYNFGHADGIALAIEEFDELVFNGQLANLI